MGAASGLDDGRVARRSNAPRILGIIPATSTIVSTRSTCKVTTIGPEPTSLAMARTPTTPPGDVARYASVSGTEAQWLTATATAKQLAIVNVMNTNVSGISLMNRRRMS